MSEIVPFPGPWNQRLSNVQNRTPSRTLAAAIVVSCELQQVAHWFDERRPAAEEYLADLRETYGTWYRWRQLPDEETQQQHLAAEAISRLCRQVCALRFASDNGLSSEYTLGVWQDGPRLLATLPPWITVGIGSVRKVKGFRLEALSPSDAVRMNVLPIAESEKDSRPRVELDHEHCFKRGGKPACIVTHPYQDLQPGRVFHAGIGIDAHVIGPSWYRNATSTALLVPTGTEVIIEPLSGPEDAA